MTLFASISLDPATLAAWLAAGLAAGWLATKALEEASYGGIGDLVLGGGGALAGGFIFSAIKENAEFWGSTVVAFVTACILIGLVRVVAARRNT